MVSARVLTVLNITPHLIASVYFTENVPAESVAKRPFVEIPEGDPKQSILRKSRFDDDQAVVAHVKLRFILDEEHAFIGGDHFFKDVLEGFLATLNPVTYADISPVPNVTPQFARNSFVQANRPKKIIAFEVATVGHLNRGRHCIMILYI